MRPLPQSGMKSPRLGAMVGSSLAGAGRGIMPALDYLAARVIGDDPVLTAALQCVSDGHALSQLKPVSQPLESSVCLTNKQAAHARGYLCV